MLANLIPGLRDIRAGLAAGYVWLACIWLVAYEKIPTSDQEATGVWQAVFQLDNAANALGIGVILSFVAYLLGTASQAALDPVARRVSRALFGGRVVDSPDGSSDALFPEKLGVLGPNLPERSWRSLDLIAVEAITRAEEDARANIRKVVQRPFTWSDEVEADAQGVTLEELRGNLDQRDERELATWLSDLVTDLTLSDRGITFHGGLSLGAIVPRFLDRISWAASAVQRIARPSGGLPAFDPALQLSVGLSLELDLVKDRLLTQDPEQYNYIDRIESESELRFALLVPLTVLVAILTSVASPWWGAGWLGVCLLFLQAVSYDRKAKSAVVDRLLVGDVVAPTIERLDRYVKEARRPRRDSSIQ